MTRASFARSPCSLACRRAAARRRPAARSSVAQWIVQERNHQGDVALAHSNYPDASVAYQLALKIDPTNVHARDGLTMRADSARADVLRRLEVRRRDRRARGRLRATRPATTACRACATRSSRPRSSATSSCRTTRSYKLTGASIQRALQPAQDAQNAEILARAEALRLHLRHRRSVGGDPPELRAQRRDHAPDRPAAAVPPARRVRRPRASAARTSPRPPACCRCRSACAGERRDICCHPEPVEGRLPESTVTREGALSSSKGSRHHIRRQCQTIAVAMPARGGTRSVSVRAPR